MSDTLRITTWNLKDSGMDGGMEHAVLSAVVGGRRFSDHDGVTTLIRVPL